MNNKIMNGYILKSIVVSGCENLKINYPEVDKLNVFPVPDGDTGTNMKMTIEGGINEISALDDQNIENVAKILSRGMLMGARGNSGVILSQLFRGLAKGFKDKTQVNAIELAAAYDSAVKQAYKAVMTPVEGTILTVAREASEKMTQIANSMMTITEFYEEYVAEAKASLARTPELLPVLKEAGVVDSGGAGYLCILEGMLSALHDKPIKAEDSNVSENFMEGLELKPHGYSLSLNVLFPEDYDAESFKSEELSNHLKDIANNLVITKTSEGLAITLRADNIGDALKAIQPYGEMVKVKITNLNVNSKEEEEPKEPQEPVKPAEHKEYAVVTVANGQGLVERLKEIGADYIVSGGQSMNPSTEDFIKAYRSLNADHIIVFPNNKNIFLAADQSAKIYKDAQIHVVPTKSIAQGLSALTMLDLSGEIDEILASLNEVIANVTSGSITYSVRDTKLAGITIKTGDYIGIVDGKIVTSNGSRFSCMKNLLKNAVTEEKEIITLIVGEGVKSRELTDVKKYIERTYPNVEMDVIQGDQDVYSYIISVE